MKLLLKNVVIHINPTAVLPLLLVTFPIIPNASAFTVDNRSVSHCITVYPKSFTISTISIRKTPTQELK